MEKLLEHSTQVLGSYIPRLIGALAILVIGWILALIVASIVQNLLKRTTVDNRLASWISEEGRTREIGIEKGISRAVFYLLMIFVLIGFFEALGITLVTAPLNGLLNRIFQFAPQLLAALVLIVIAWIVAKVMRLLVSRALSAMKIDERLGSRAGIEKQSLPLAKTFSDAIYWLVFLLFLPAVLSTLELEGLLRPVQDMTNKILDFLPNIVTAGLIFFAGWLVARVVQRIVSSLLEAVGTEHLSARVGMSTVLGKQKLSGVLGLIVYIVILIPILIASLNALQLEALTQPASKMLEMILLALPRIFAAGIIVVIAYVVGRLIAGLVSNLLAGIGLDGLLARLGIGKDLSEKAWMPSTVAGYLVLICVMFFAVIEASNQLGFSTLSGLMAQLMVLVSHIALGLIIFALGLFLSMFVSKAILGTSVVQAHLLAVCARIGIVVLAAAMGLRQMGLANEIVNLAFGLIVGAIALGVAIALGLGGREIAAREMDAWVQSLKSRKAK